MFPSCPRTAVVGEVAAEARRAPLAVADDPSALPTERLEGELTELAAHIAAATRRWLLLVAELDRREAQVASGFQGCAQWLSWRCAIAPRAAREHVRVARRLRELPAIQAAFARGELSYSQVRAITRVADSEQEGVLVGLARHASAAQLERLVRAYRGALSLESAREAHARRFLDWQWEEDGSLSLRARLSAEEGALLLQALAAGRDGLRGQARAEQEQEVSAPVDAADAPEARSPSNADALVAMADALLARGGAARSSADRYQVVVHADAEALAGVAPSQAGTGQSAPARCALEDGPAICPETARRLACDAALVKLVEQDGRPLSVGRRTRSVPAALRRALRSRDPGCRFPGCGNQRWLDAHHIHHWARGGATALDNLVHLCRHHHRLLHEGGFSVAGRAGGSLAFWRPDGTRVPATPAVPRGRASALPTRNRRLGIDITHSTLVDLSAGERMDLGLAVSGLLELAQPS